MQNEGPFKSSFGIENHGIADAGTVYWNLPPARLHEMASERTRHSAQVTAKGEALRERPLRLVAADALRHTRRITRRTRRHLPAQSYCRLE